MWTGDVQSGYPTQWALNPSTYQNLPNEQVDWASLAQQWIKMKETFPEPQPQPQPQVPPAPPPPSIQADIEAGEAPMDVTKDEHPSTPPPPSVSAGPQDGGNWGSWGNWQQQWGWGWGGPPDSYPSPSVAPPAATFDYNHGNSIPDNFEQGQQGYWSEGPAPFVRNKGPPADWRPDRVPSRRQSGKVEEAPEPDTTTLFDAAKRKQLPAWIREGLEKMEREKQKKLERERQLKEREEELIRRKQEEEEALASGVQLKSKFDTDSEESDKEAEPEMITKPRKSRFDSTSTPQSTMHPKSSHSYSPPPVKRKSRDEAMQEVMQQVRYVLTDILMTVTNEEMRKIAEEVLADFRAKAPASRLRQTPALTSLTGKLGLGIYDSDSEDSSSESDHERLSKQNGVDSDEELRERINRKKQEFARIERDIEHQVEEQEERDRERQAEEEEEEDERVKETAQVEPKLQYPGNRVDIKTEELKINPEPIYEHYQFQSFTPEKIQKEKDSSVDRSEDSHSSSKSDSSSSRSSSSSRHKKSKKSKRKKEKKSSKKKRKRSRSRSSDRRKSHKKSSHSHRYERSRSRSRSHYRRHSSESSHRRRHHSRSRSRSPDYSRGKRSSHRSRD